jgi:hypothetical protein
LISVILRGALQVLALPLHEWFAFGLVPLSFDFWLVCNAGLAALAFMGEPTFLAVAGKREATASFKLSSIGFLLLLGLTLLITSF